MNNKELTELKKFIDGRIEFLFDHWVEHDKPPYTFGGWREEVVNDIANKLTSLNDEIKREAVENFRNWVINRQTEDGYKYKMWYEYIEEYLTQKENNE